MDRRGLITAIRTLTAVPVGGKDAADFSDSLIWFPPVGLLLGLALWCAGALWERFVGTGWAAGGAVVLMALQILLTRALHLDGLADLADALGSGREREKRLRIMKDPHVGSFGVIAIGIDLLAKWAALERLLLVGALPVLIPVCLISRGVMVMLMARLPYARMGERNGQTFSERPLQREGAGGGCPVALSLPFFRPSRGHAPGGGMGDCEGARSVLQKGFRGHHRGSPRDRQRVRGNIASLGLRLRRRAYLAFSEVGLVMVMETPYRHGGFRAADHARLNGKGVVDFSVNLNPLGPPPIVREQWERLFDSIVDYPSVEGEGLGLFYQERYGIPPGSFLPETVPRR